MALELIYLSFYIFFDKISELCIKKQLTSRRSLPFESDSMKFPRKMAEPTGGDGLASPCLKVLRLEEEKAVRLG
jgi:hypothetical protein